MTQGEVADAAGIDRPVYNRLEAGKRSFTEHYAAKLAAILGADVWALTDRSGSSGAAAAAMQSYDDRLRELAAEVQDLRRERDALLEAVVGRLVRLEEAVGMPVQQEVQPSSDG